MMQTTILREVNLDFTPTAFDEKKQIAFPEDAKVIDDVVFPEANVSAEHGDDLPPYNLVPAALRTSDAKKAIEQKPATEHVCVDFSLQLRPPSYVEPKPMFLPIPSTVCVDCSNKSEYWGPVSDKQAWKMVFFQIIENMIAMLSFCMTLSLTLTGVCALIVYPVGLSLLWASSVVSRSFGSFTLNLFDSLTATTTEACKQCTPGGRVDRMLPENILPSSTKASLHKKISKQILDGYSLKTQLYSLINMPIATICFTISITSVVVGIAFFPLLPLSLRLVNWLTQLQRKVANSTLSHKSL
ncbi:hypothetical protein AX774_g316 [Zancudomyces culisetae]|uniref:Sensor domain-containing protein n=1 Tax=Zancudomyces culisetae TaxID=1213189 RepID=A0A1R1PYX2_ZANCU|nr:hypothetical protein AX774_g7453 [Zancudomyces culisetae]OMH86129.1 hypothetical protein AX774_g316 [Zancudomyces culisetae]|eukprot:OMH79141.1 hypothetical protein AX774_g7453 [Zancudomyces culisetae]